MSPNLISLSHSDLFYLSGVLAFTCRLLGQFNSRCFTLVHALLGVSFILFFIFRNTVFNVQHQPYVLTTNSCGDYRRVWCGILFKAMNSCTNICSTSMILAGRPHFQVPWSAFVLRWMSRRATVTLFVNVFTLINIVSIAAEEPSVVHDNLLLFYTSRLHLSDFSWYASASPTLPLGAWTSHWLPICR